MTPKEKTTKMAEALANHILAECEKEGLTLGESRLLMSSVKLRVDEALGNLSSAVCVTGFLHDVKNG